MIFTRVATALGTITDVPYAADANRSVLGDPLPDLFIVYSLVSEAPELHADDAEQTRFNRVQLSIYNRAGMTNPPDTDTAMAGQGFRFARARALPYNPETGHYGLMREYTILLDQE